MHQIRKFKDGKVTHKEQRLNLAYSLCQPLLDMRIGGNHRVSLPGPGQLPADLSRPKGKHFSKKKVQRRVEREEGAKCVEARGQRMVREKIQKLLINVYSVTCIL